MEVRGVKKGEEKEGRGRRRQGDVSRKEERKGRTVHGSKEE